MITSLALIFLVGLSMAFICQKIKIPRIIGMLITGIVLGPFVLNFLDPSILGISAELRRMALIIILIKAGLSLDISDLKEIECRSCFAIVSKIWKALACCRSDSVCYGRRCS